MDNPLTKRDLADIKDALYKISEVNQVVGLLERLGQDVTEIQAKIEFYKQVLTTLRTELFPEIP